MKTKLLHPIARLLLAILMCLPICGSHAFAQEAESYAVFDEATNTLTFKHDTNKPTGAFALNEGYNAPGWYKSNGYVSNANTIEKVVFDASFANARPTSCCKWFFGCTDLTTIEGIEYLNTENVTEMSGMFCGCKALTMLDVSKFDTKNVQSMSSMFWGCHALTTLDISNFDTQNVTEMSGMFDGCSALTTIYASDKFVTTACKYDYNMFEGCTNLVGAVPYDEYKIGKEMANYTTGYFTDIASKVVESYAVFDEATNTLTFKHDTNKPDGAFALNEGDNAPGWYKSNDDGSNANIIKKVVFDASFANARPTSCYEWFFGCTDLTTIEGIEYLNTENVTDMSGMFYGCSALTTLDVSNFDTKNVTNMSNMFHWCLALTTLDVSNFDTKNVTNMRGMFYNCHALTTLNVSNFDTQNVTNMSNMFSVCSALTTLDVSNFDTKNVTDMSWMFSFNPALTTIYASDKFVTTACEKGQNMFKDCANLVGAVPYDENKVGKEMANYTTGYFTDITSKAAESYAVFDEATNTLTFKHDTNKPDGAFALNEGENLPNWYRTDFYGNNSLSIKKVVFDASFANARPTSCYRWFFNCKYLTTIEGIEYLNTENVTNMSGMFWGCAALTTLDVSHFDTQNVTDMSYMFSSCSALTTLDVSKFDTKNVTNMSYMFSNCKALTILDVSKFDTKNVTNMSYMFSSCSALTTLDVSKFDTKNVTDMNYMFYQCSVLTTLDVSNFDTKNVTDMDGMFCDCDALTTLDVSNFDTRNVTNMNSMFYSCSALTTLDLSNFDTQNVTNMSYMFSNCPALTTLDVSNFDTKNVTDMSWMFSFNPALITIYASDKFVTTACEFDDCMFEECANLVGAVPYDENKVGKEMANYTTGYFTDIASKVAESYAVFDEDTNTLTFKHDTNKPAGAFALNEGDNAPGWYKSNDDGSNANIIKKVVFDASFANARPTSCYKWFYGCTDLTTIEGIEYLNTENVTNMGWMFSDCEALTILDVSNFDTKNVTNMRYMFSICFALTTLDVSNFDTQNVTNMSNMFSDCSALTTLDLSNFDTKNVTDMSWMFSFDTALITIYASDKFVTTACEKGQNMFKDCTNLVGAVPYDENKVGKEMANYTTGYFTDKAATGIDAPTVSDDTAAEYYDLQGRRLSAPQKGVNIVKRGKKTTKMLVK